MNIKKVTLIGGGVLGSQIAYQAAYCEFDVTIYMRTEASVGRTKPKMERLYNIYLSELEAAKSKCGDSAARVSRGLIPDIGNTTVEQVDELIRKAKFAYENLVYEMDLAKAVEGADIVIEAMAENPEQKMDMYSKLASVMDEKTILATNSSTLLPSSFAEYTGRPDRYIAMHFANNIWSGNTAEIMGHEGTSQTVYDEVVAFAKAINMIPLCLHKEQPGYILNSLLVPFLNAAEHLWAKGGADPETAQGKRMCMLKEKIDAGETGINVGKGFYTY